MVLNTSDDTYKIELKKMSVDSAHYEFTLDEEFFRNLQASEVQKGALNVFIDVCREQDSFVLTFRTEGSVTVACDRCLDDLELPISSVDRLRVKWGKTYAESDDAVVVPEEEGFIDVAWLMYELIVLRIPMKHVHEAGLCNEEMIRKYKAHLSPMADDFSGKELCERAADAVDPRWNDLKQISDSN
ncbi:DUF177 domain-containing protein [Phocaeicola abscessus]|uniref:YceD family protein n=1 Tax=Phocaeicola abscessus TaxID=555313 RepID=UPI0028E659EC|nr:DUF177 domain-containing protein [Phocaeicola abscessus]